MTNPHNSRNPRSTTRTATAAAVVVLAALAGCAHSGTSGDGAMMGGDGMGSGAVFRNSALTCSAPASLPGTRVTVRLGDVGMTRPMGGIASMNSPMRLNAMPRSAPAGRITFVVANTGWRTHELVVLPLAGGASAGQRAVGADGKVSETGSLGEASTSCGEGTGEGIDAGTVGWTTLTLPAGRYELVCNLQNHYADGMHQEFTVT